MKFAVKTGKMLQHLRTNGFARRANPLRRYRSFLKSAFFVKEEGGFLFFRTIGIHLNGINWIHAYFIRCGKLNRLSAEAVDSGKRKKNI